MTNEIKEILSLLNSTSWSNEAKQIADYITNLQNEIFDLKDTIQNKNDCIGAYECIIEDRDKRIDKAVEYIENNFLYHYGSYKEPIIFEDNYIQELYDILRGDE